MPEARIIFRSSSGYRVLIKVQYAKDGSIYISHGHKSTRSRIYESDITIEKGVKSKDSNFREHLKLKLPPDIKGHHTGLKASGIILDKYVYENDKQYNRFDIKGLTKLTNPILIEQIIPGDLGKYIKRESERKLDYIIPNEPETLEEITNNSGFRFELWLSSLEKQPVSSLVHPNALIAVDMILETKILTVFLVQDETDINRGRLDNTFILRYTVDEKTG